MVKSKGHLGWIEVGLRLALKYMLWARKHHIEFLFLDRLMR